MENDIIPFPIRIQSDEYNPATARPATSPPSHPNKLPHTTIPYTHSFPLPKLNPFRPPFPQPSQDAYYEITVTVYSVVDLMGIIKSEFCSLMARGLQIIWRLHALNRCMSFLQKTISSFN